MPTSVRLDPETEARLDQLAQQTGRTRAFYIREAIESSLSRLEWEYSLMQRVTDVRAGRSDTYTLEEVRDALELDD